MWSRDILLDWFDREIEWYTKNPERDLLDHRIMQRKLISGRTGATADIDYMVRALGKSGVLIPRSQDTSNPEPTPDPALLATPSPEPISAAVLASQAPSWAEKAPVKEKVFFTRKKTSNHRFVAKQADILRQAENSRKLAELQSIVDKFPARPVEKHVAAEKTPELVQALWEAGRSVRCDWRIADILSLDEADRTYILSKLQKPATPNTMVQEDIKPLLQKSAALLAWRVFRPEISEKERIDVAYEILKENYMLALDMVTGHVKNNVTATLVQRTKIYAE